MAVNADTVGPATYTEEDPQMSGQDKQGTLSNHTMEGPVQVAGGEMPSKASST